MKDWESRWSFAKSDQEAKAFRSEAERIVGETLSEVRYIDLDYDTEQVRGIIAGPRLVTSSQEWAVPSWKHPACHSIDHAVELRTVSGAVFTVSWESPGQAEGIGLRERRALGSAVTDDADVAIWDVSAIPGWADLIGQEVRSVELGYRDWGDASALWCPRIDLVIGVQPVVLLLAEGVWNTDKIRHSSDTVVVVFASDVDFP